jgi:Cu/Ag efflux pump CusA
VLAGRYWSIGALLGFITLFAVAMRDGITMVHRLQFLANEHTSLDDEDAPAEPGLRGIDLALRAIREGAGPVLLSAGAIALVLAPFALGLNIAGEEILHPLALVVIGGLITTTMFTIVILPALYIHLVARRQRPAPPPDTSPLTAPPAGASLASQGAVS